MCGIGICPHGLADHMHHPVSGFSLGYQSIQRPGGRPHDIAPRLIVPRFIYRDPRAVDQRTQKPFHIASLLVEEGLGYAICFDRIINTSGDSRLTFRPLLPSIEIEMYMIWKKYQVFSKPAEKFLMMMQENVNTI